METVVDPNADQTLWDQLFSARAVAGKHGDALVLVTGRQPGVAALAAWRTAIEKHLITEDGEQKFATQTYILPARATELREALANATDSAGGHKPNIVLFETNELDEVAQLLHLQPTGTAVALLGLENVRATAKVAVEDDAASSSWTGLQHRARSQLSRHKHHFIEVIREVVSIAKNRQLFITCIVTLPSMIAAGLIDALGEPENLILIATEPTATEQIEHRLTQLAHKVASGAISIDKAVDLTNHWIIEPNRRALAQSQLLFLSGQFNSAWQAVAPYIETYVAEHPAVYLNLGHAARAALEPKQAVQLLQAAEQAGIRSLDDLHTAYLLAVQLREQALAQRMFARMRAEFPNDEITRSVAMETALAAGDYAEAEKIARQRGNESEAALWKQLAAPQIEVESLLERAATDEQRDRIFSAAAVEMVRRADFTTAESWAREVRPQSMWARQAMLIRVRCFGQGLLSSREITDHDVDELLPLLSYVAMQPTDHEMRFELERVFEDTVNIVDTTVLLSAALHRLLPSVYPARRGPEVRAPSEGELDSAVEWFSELLPSLQLPLLALGVGDIPSALSERVSPALIGALLYVVQQVEIQAAEPQVWTALLVAMELACRAIGEPSKDLLGSYIVIQRLSMAAGMQTARDLAEHVLQTLPARQPEHQTWRTGLAWAAVAEGFAAARNPTPALLNVCLAFAAIEGRIVDSEAFCTVLRLATRIQRDLNLAPFAMQTLQVERQVREHIGATTMLWQLEQLELSLRLQEADSTAARMKLFLATVRHLRVIPSSGEKLPVVSLAVNLVRTMRAEGVTIPVANLEELTEALAESAGFYASYLSALLTGVTNVGELIPWVEKLGEGTRWDDIATQLRPAQLLAEDALDAAWKTSDYELFGLAASLLSQPVLTFQAIDRPHDPETDKTRFRRWAIELLKSRSDSGQLGDAAEVIRKIGPAQLHSISQIATRAIRELPSVLADSEAVLFVVEGERDSIFTCLVTDRGPLWIRRLSESAWSPQRYQMWRSAVRSGYGKKESPSGAGWRAEDIRSSMHGLSLEVNLDVQSLVIVPSAALFTFPFPLLTSRDRFLYEMMRIEVVPSFAWLLEARAQPGERRGARLWAGAPSSRDPVLADFHKFILPGLRFANQQLVAEKDLQSTAGAAVAIVVLHGVRDSAGEFRSLTDGSRFFTAAELAQAAEGWQTVVLCVCYGGRTSVATNTAETRGVISALIGAGVRAVIASDWPVSLEILACWLPRFLHEAGAGVTVADAAWVAAKSVSDTIPDRAAPATFRIFGDAVYCVRSG